MWVLCFVCGFVFGGGGCVGVGGYGGGVYCWVVGGVCWVVCWCGGLIVGCVLVVGGWGFIGWWGGVLVCVEIGGFWCCVCGGCCGGDLGFGLVCGIVVMWLFWEWLFFGLLYWFL